MATTKITSPELFDLGSLNTALQLPSGTTAQRPASPSTGEWRYNTDNNLIEFYDGVAWRDLQDEDIPPIPSENFNTVLYTGNGSTQSITGVGFQPDFIAIKDRSATNSWRIFDSTRGLTSPQTLYFNLNFAEDSESNTVSSFDADGFTMGSQGGVNTNGNNYLAYCWKANGGTTSSNTDGTETSTVQVNTKGGFSIVQWTSSTSGSSTTVGHGLGTTPAAIILKRTDSAEDWYVWHKELGGGGSSALNQFLRLNLTDTESTATNLFNTVNSTVFNPSYTGAVPNTNIAYCFAEKAGYSSFGSYTGNASDNGPIVNTGFEPAWLMIKGRTSAVDGWFIVNNKSDTSNPRGIRVFANSNVGEAEEPGAQVDFFTNGFQIRGSGAGQGQVNKSGANYVYFAFAKDASSAPVLADSFKTTLYTGGGTSQAVTGLGFKPSLLWIKSRNNTSSSTFSHSLFDSMRTNGYRLISNSTAAQNDYSAYMTGFNTDGFSLVGDPLNDSSGNYVAWAWKAGTPAINTDGSTTAIVSANVAAGFSIVHLPSHASSYTVGHGLDGVPDLIITRVYDGVSNWLTYNSVNGARNYMFLNTTAGNTAATPGYEYDSVTATTFTNLISASTLSYIHYCFKSVAGFSNVGSYNGNSSTQSITGLGFQPSWVMIKRYDGTENWYIQDSARGSTKQVYANLTNAEFDETNAVTSFDSDGFTMGSYNGVNNSGESYIYVAFKENPSTPAAIPAGEVAYLVVGAGGGGGGVGGGAGAGGLRTSYGNYTGGGQSAESNITLSAQTYTITIGAGGTASATGGTWNYDGNTGSNGTNSVFGTITSLGGGGGTGSSNQALNGGSGGGARFLANGYGQGQYGQGFDGATGDIGGGGGGAGGAGLSSTAGSCGAGGGPGLNVPITGATTYYAGGGGGGASLASGCSATSGGVGGGGNSGANNGTANTGGGGGGGNWTNNGNVPDQAGGNGGSGVVILRMNTSDYSGTTTGSPTVTTVGSETILTYTGSGTYVHS